MLQRLILCTALVCALLATGGLAQTPPSQCASEATFRINRDREDIFIVPGVINCFSCNLDEQGDIAWEVENAAGDFVSPAGSDDADTGGNFLIIPMPDNYVQPGTAGRQNINCIRLSDNVRYETRLSSPILNQPTFEDATVNETTTLKISCITRNIANIISFAVLNPQGVPVETRLGVYEVANVTRDFAGQYTCVINSTRDDSSVRATSTVIIQYTPEVTAGNDTVQAHRIILGQELRLSCSYDGVPDPTVAWFRDDTMLMDGVNGATITGGGPGDNDFSLVISSVVRESMGTYTCRANNLLGMDEEQYSVVILVPADPVANLMMTGVGETSVSLSWMTGGDGFTPITSIEILVTPERGNPPNTITLPPTNSTTVMELLPFREHEFSVAVINRAGTSERRNITVDTLSLRLGMPTDPRLAALSSTSLQFTWEPPMFNPNTTDAPDRYLVDFSLLDNSNHIPQNVPASDPREITFNGLAKGTEYIARVTPVNARGNGTGTSFIATRTLFDPPSEPQNLTVIGVGAQALRVLWSVPADNGGAVVSNYRVFVDSINFSKVLPSNTTSLLIRDGGLVESTAYTVLVGAANNEQGFGNNATEMGTTQSIREPQTIFDQPTSDMGESTNSSAVLRWEAPLGTVDTYTVQYVLSKNGFDSPDVVTLVVNGSETSVMVENVLPGASYDFRVAVNNSRGMSAFSIAGEFITLQPDPAIISVSHTNPVNEGATIILNCTATLRGNIVYTWTLGGTNVEDLDESMFEVNPGYLRIIMVTTNSQGEYRCKAENGDGTMTISEIFELQVQPTEAPRSGGIDQTVIIIVASVGGAALLIFVAVVLLAICCLCKMNKRSKSSYSPSSKPMKLKERPNANWIETSTQFVPATGNQAASATEGDRLAFDYSVDLQTHSSFNTLEKQKVHSTANGSDQPPPPSYSDDTTDV